MRLGIIGFMALIAAYVASLLIYVDSGMGHPHQVNERQPGGNATTVTVDIEDIRSNNSVLATNISVVPSPALLDPVTHKLKEDLSVEVTSVVTPSKRSWSKGAVPDVWPVSLILSGEVADWPFDEYRSKPVTIEVERGASDTPEPATVIFVDRLLGWTVDMSSSGPAAPGPYQVELSRTMSTVAFGFVIVFVYLALGGLGLVVAVQTWRNKRKFQPPMTTWYAAMLFAVMPLRNALPDSPPFGSWIDISVVLWAIVVLVISMMIYILCWWRHLAPEPAELAASAKTPR
ncbi:DUF4436 domain-containing protein [Mycobacterium rhizamassiliense]|jgi:hypothetical protein|uniref:DUF4436 domain-containing protein n=1 Tax=Mycobacterium rhizamassiliense TaxID=1841860 RepID=A0A2U3NMT1_9MYCO|nr:DUF4436 domain-containing protein [Mycobacterium rhizamassiliense]SPM32754.1 DUF4436 domain-containing protein [Mycobacterium rhizamassiliense]